MLEPYLAWHLWVWVGFSVALCRGSWFGFPRLSNICMTTVNDQSTSSSVYLLPTIWLVGTRSSCNVWKLKSAIVRHSSFNTLWPISKQHLSALHTRTGCFRYTNLQSHPINRRCYFGLYVKGLSTLLKIECSITPLGHLGIPVIKNFL